MNMKVCIIGGTGTISTPITKLLMEDDSVNLTLVNRGHSLEKLDTSKITLWISDINDKEKMETYLKDAHFDVVINFINFMPEDIERDIKYFKDKTDQYIFISTNVVLNHHEYVLIDETTPIGNRISQYGQNKAACEAILKAHPDFPYTIVRPSHTYSDDRFPVSIKGSGTWTVFDRISKQQEIIVQDGGQSIWPITHANDFARLFISLVGNKESIHEVYHIMNPTPITWDMIYQEIALQTSGKYLPVYISSKLLEKSKKYNYREAISGDKAFSNIFNIDKILKLNKDFEFEYDLKKGISTYLNYMATHQSLKIVEDDFNEWSDKTIEAYKKMIDTFKVD